MYGLVLEGVRYFIINEYDMETYEKCLKEAGLDIADFCTHSRYSEKIVPNLLQALAKIKGQNIDQIGLLTGRYFVRYTLQFGYGDLLRVSSSRFADFVRGLDNLHEYFRFSYPKIKPPSFYCEREDAQGIVLHYRSRRSGYLSYVIGQLKEVSRQFFGTSVDIEVHRTEQRRGIVYAIMRINFDNHTFENTEKLQLQMKQFNIYLPVDTKSFLDMFPYHIGFDKNMMVISAGRALRFIKPDLIGKPIDTEFNLIRPFIKFNFEGCKHHANNIFKLEAFKKIRRSSNSKIAVKVNNQLEDRIELTKKGKKDDDSEDKKDGVKAVVLRLRGQMVHIKKSDVIICLATAEIESLDEMFSIGLYINDYSLSDCNREMIMASVQQSDSLKELLHGEQEKLKQLSNNLRQIDSARKQANQLLCEMMPRSIAKQLLNNKDNAIIWQSYEEVTICFAKVKDFMCLTEEMPAMAVVSLLNNVYSMFDSCIERHNVYKVETIGENYMIASGLPTANAHHAEYMADTAIDILDAMARFCQGKEKKVQIKIGMHCGTAVGGVIGSKAPRFCLFGDTVNCASRMESHNNVSMTTMASSTAKSVLENKSPGLFTFKARGEIDVKGKGKMEVFEIVSKKGPPKSVNEPTGQELEEIFESEIQEDRIYTPMEDEHRAATAGISMSRMSMSRFSSMASQTDDITQQPINSPPPILADQVEERKKQNKLRNATTNPEDGPLRKTSPVQHNNDNKRLKSETDDVNNQSSLLDDLASGNSRGSNQKEEQEGEELKTSSTMTTILTKQNSSEGSLSSTDERSMSPDHDLYKPEYELPIDPSLQFPEDRDDKTSFFESPVVDVVDVDRTLENINDKTALENYMDSSFKIENNDDEIDSTYKLKPQQHQIKTGNGAVREVEPKVSERGKSDSLRKNIDKAKHKTINHDHVTSQDPTYNCKYAYHLMVPDALHRHSYEKAMDHDKINIEPQHPRISKADNTQTKTTTSDELGTNNLESANKNSKNTATKKQESSRRREDRPAITEQPRLEQSQIINLDKERQDIQLLKDAQRAQPSVAALEKAPLPPIASPVIRKIGSDISNGRIANGSLPAQMETDIGVITPKCICGVERILKKGEVQANVCTLL